MTFYKSNVFYAPFDPYRPIYIHSSWQANDPLVHYLTGQLSYLNLQPTNRVNFASQNPPLHNIGMINDRYEPWGGSLTGRSYSDVAPFDLAAKDPQIMRSDNWDFPTDRPLSIGWIGAVHRGTPWQTVYLKSPAISYYPWWRWVGADTSKEALGLHPTNDWRIASRLALLFNTNDPHALFSVNQATAEAWRGVLDGLIAVTNTGPGQFESIVMSSNSTQVASMSGALAASRSRQPGQAFRNVGDTFATPQLSIASPWLSTETNRITDAVCEIVPSQLLEKLRPDPIGSIKASDDSLEIQFSGFDGYPYGIEVSPDLLQWTGLSTNYPVDGILEFSEQKPQVPGGRFYRSRLLP